MPRLTEEETIYRRIKKTLEEWFRESRLYRDLVYLSKLVKMLIYLGTGISIIIVVFLGKPFASLEDLIHWMSQTFPGRIIALFVAFCLIIYGLEKLR
jgi:hypothetical protein